jgi:hypothetical protein
MALMKQSCCVTSRFSLVCAIPLGRVDGGCWMLWSQLPARWSNGVVHDRGEAQEDWRLHRPKYAAAAQTSCFAS